MTFTGMTTPGGAPVTRRDLLKGVLLATGATALGGLAAGCGSTAGKSSSPTTPATSNQAAASPKRGGTFRFGLTGGTSADTLDPLRVVTIVDFSRYPQIYDPLVGFNSMAQPTYVLAEEITPNADATLWTIRVRSGVEFHDGKEVTAEDIAYLLRVSSDTKKPVAGTNLVSLIDGPAIKVRDKYTVAVPCHAPFATLVDSLASYYFSVVPANYDPKNPIGTGPFKYKEFTPGQSSTFVRNDNYWVTGLPYFDEVVITDFADEDSQVNALLSGQLDGIGSLTSPSIAAVTSGGGKIKIGNGGSWNPFTMRVDRPPFNDPQVRQAMQLIVDRPQMLEVVFGGHGAIGNDLYSIWDPFYDHSLPQRHQDLAQAKYLLKKAGHEGLAISLVTSDIAAGVVRAAQVFAQQATGAGVKVTLQQVTPTDFFGPQYLNWTFSQDEWIYFPYFPQVGLASIANAPFNETHYQFPQFVNLYHQALRTVDDTQRKAIAQEMQSYFYRSSGYIVPAFTPEIDGYSKRLMGVEESHVGLPFNNFNFKAMWFA